MKLQVYNRLLSRKIENSQKTIKKILLHHDQNGKYRFLIYSTKSNLKVLRRKECERWRADATFDCVPIIFKQLYTIHGVYRNKSLPLYYVLMPKNQKNCTQKY